MVAVAEKENGRLVDGRCNVTSQSAPPYVSDNRRRCVILVHPSICLLALLMSMILRLLLSRFYSSITLFGSKLSASTYTHGDFEAA